MIHYRIGVVHQFWGLHHYPSAADSHYYLAQKHRHTFHMTVEMDVKHEDRAMEFLSVQEKLESLFPSGEDWGMASCEALATQALQGIAACYPEAKNLCVKVSEDGGNYGIAMEDDQ